MSATSGKRQKMVTPPTDVVERFVLRARRISAHSLARSADQLHKQSRSLFTATLDLAGNVALREELPDEEAFESLVARLRPLTVDTESIHYAAVLDAIIALLGSTATIDEMNRIDDLRNQWDATHIQGTQIQGYTVQTVDQTGGATPPVSDTQLAAGWLYADLVHADARGPKAESLQFSLRARYTAAVRIFSQIAALTLETLDLVQDLHTRSRLALSPQPWCEEVTVTDEKTPYNVQVFHADLGTPAPGLNTPMTDAPHDWKPLTVTDLLGQDPANTASATLHHEHGTETIDAVILHHRTEDTGAHWDMLVSGCAVFNFTFTLDKGTATSAALTAQNFLELTNTLKLESTRLARRMRNAERVEFGFPGGASVTMSMHALDEDDDMQSRVWDEVLGDVVAIETITRHQIPTCNGPFTDIDRVRLRQTRLLWEGHLVRTRLRDATVTSPNGRPPQVITIRAASIVFAGQRIPTPPTSATHPQLHTTPLGPEPDTGQARDYIVRAPDGEHLIAWSPEHVIRTSTPPEPSPWDLIGIDEASFQP